MKWAVTDLLICLINLCFCLLNLLKIKPYLCLDFSSINDWQRLSWKLTQFLTYLLHRYDSYGENRKIQWKGHMCLFPLRQQIKYNKIQIKHWICQNEMNIVIFNATNIIFPKEENSLQKCIQRTEGFIYRIQCCTFIFK